MKPSSTLFHLLIILVLAVASCAAPAGSDADPLLLKCWTHAFEEDTPENGLTFRSCINHTFPAARYRQTFTLQENGVVEYSVLAPNDAHTTENGKWNYNAKSKKLKISNNENAVMHEYEVVELGEDMLRVKE